MRTFPFSSAVQRVLVKVRYTESLTKPLAALLLGAVLFAAAPQAAVADPIDDYNLAVKFFQQKRWAFAADLARDFLKASPEHEKAPLARLYLGQSLAQQKKFDEARDVFREFVKLHPGHKEAPLAYYRIGECSYFVNDREAAEAELGDFIKRFPKDDLAPYARHYLGETLLASKRYLQAVEQFQQVVAATSDASLKEDAGYGLAESFRGQGQLPEAIQSFTSVLQSNGRRAAEALFAIGSIQYEMGQYEKALASFQDFESRYPGSPLLPTAQLNAGYAAYQLKDYVAARDRFNAARQRPEQALAAKYWLALTNHAEGKYVYARLDFAEIVEKEADVPPLVMAKAMFYLGDCELRTDMFAEALSTFEKLVAQFPSSEVASNALHEATDAALRLGDFSKATELNSQFEQKYADSPFAPRQKLLYAKAAIQQVEKDPANAAVIAQAEQSLKSLLGQPGGLDERARMELARLHQTLNQPEEALKAIEPILARPDADDLFTDIRLLAASLYLETEQAEQAVAVAERVQKDTAGKNTVALQYLARAQAALNRWPEAESAITQIPEGAARTAVLVDAAESAFAAKAWERAAEWFSLAITDANAPVAAYSGLGYSRFELKQFKEAATAFASMEGKTVGNRPLASTAAWMRGLSLQSADDTVAAQQVFEAGTASFAAKGDIMPAVPAEVDVVFNAYQMAKQAARIAREAGETERADRYYDVAVNQMQRLPEAQKASLDKLINEWALLAYESEQFDRSDELFRKLIEVAPNSEFSDDAKLYLAESAFFAGEVAKARTAFQELATSDTSDEFVKERSSLLLLDIASEERDWVGLKLTAERFLQKFPESKSSLYAKFRLGEAHLRTGELKETIDVLGDARSVAKANEATTSPWVPSIWVFLAEAAVQQKQYGTVDELSEEFGKLFPESPYQYQVDEILGRSLKNRAEFEKAREALTRVTDSEAGRRTETAAKSQLLIAETYLLEKNFAEALKAYYKVYVNYAFPEYQAPALFQAASCDESLEQWAKAAETYRILIEEFPTSEYATQAKPKLDAVKLRIP